MQYQFDVRLAKDFGVDEAIFCHNLYFWCLRNEANGENIREYEGKTYAWSYNSMEAFSQLFPFWTKRQIERIVKSCREKNLVIAVNFADSPYDRTLWYAVTETVVSTYANGDMTFPRTVKCKDSIYNINNLTDSKPDSIVRPRKYGENGWVKLTDDELQKLIEKYGEVKVAKAIEYIDLQAEKTKNKNGWKSWRAVLQNAIKNNWGGVADE